MTVRPYKVLLLVCVVNCTAGTPTPRLCPVVQWSVHWAPSRTTRVLVLAGARRCALETCGKKNASSSFRLGEIYIFILQIRVILARRDKIVRHSKNVHFSNDLDFYVDIFKLHVTFYFFMFMRRGMNFTFWQYLDYVTCTLSVINFIGFCVCFRCILRIFRGQATQKLHVRLNSPNIEVPPSQTYYECNRYKKPVKRKNKARSKAVPQEPFPLPPTLAQNH